MFTAAGCRLQGFGERLGRQQQLHACVGDANSSRRSAQQSSIDGPRSPKSNTGRTSRGRGNLLATSQ
jgi:hypothetical protein